MAIIATYPTTLVNGTTGDATQVMSLFNFIQSQVNSGALALTGGTATGNIVVAPTTGIAAVTVTAAAGQTASYYLGSTGARQWVINTGSGGNFNITDVTGNVNCLNITPGAGLVTVTHALTVLGAFSGSTGSFSSNLTVSGNFATNQINGTGIYGNHLQSSNDLYVAGGSTLVGTIGCNAINCGPLNSQGNTITASGAGVYGGYLNSSGNLDVGAQISGNTVVANGITSNGNATVAGNFQCNNNVNSNTVSTNGISCNGHISVVDGVTYSNLGNHTIGFNNSGATLTFFALGGTTASWTFSVSDERLKTNIAPPQGNALTDLMAVNLISFDYTGEGRDPAYQPMHLNYGFSAQQLKTVIPEAISTAESSDPAITDGLLLTLDMLPLLARCVGAIQQLEAKVGAMTTKLDALEARLSAEGR